MTTYTVVRLLTTASLAGLLFEIGLRLTLREVLHSMRDRRMLGRIVAANFLLVPALALGLTAGLGLDRDASVAILLLAAAPFAPVVPIFTKMVRGDLALAASLTALFPFASAFLTPVVCLIGLRWVPGAGALQFSFGTILLVLLATITLPLAAGVAVNHLWPPLSQRLLKPIEIVADVAGAASLGFVTWVEWEAMTNTGWLPLLTMALLGELSLVLGYRLGGPQRAARRVTAFGTSNRNIALAILVAIDSFAGTPILPAVVACGLLLIFLGLLHVAWWRFLGDDGQPIRPAVP
jgi:BASS family bile acid:Na+ symporter